MDSKKKIKEIKEAFILNFNKAYKRNNFNIKKTCADLEVNYERYLRWRKKSQSFSIAIENMMDNAKHGGGLFPELSNDNNGFNFLNEDQLQEVRDYQNKFFSSPEVYKKVTQNLLMLSERNWNALEYILKNIYKVTPVENESNPNADARVIHYELPLKEPER